MTEGDLSPADLALLTEVRERGLQALLDDWQAALLVTPYHPDNPEAETALWSLWGRWSQGAYLASKFGQKP